jgi:branched-chain amino acid transport system permease protein
MRFLRSGWHAEAIALVGCAFLAITPLLGPSDFYYSLMFVALTGIALSVSWVIFGGYAGYYNFGPPAFYGLGAYTVAILVTRVHANPFLAIPVSFFAAGLFGAFVGLITLRIRGPYFSLFTLFMAFSLMTLINAVPAATGGVAGLQLPFLSRDPKQETVLFQLLAVGCLALAIGAAIVVQRSRLMLALNAIRDDEDVAEAMGVNTSAVKIFTFSLSCALMGPIGGITALHNAFVDPAGMFNLYLGIIAILGAVIGGLRSWVGAVVGAIALFSIDYGTRFSLPPGASRIAFGLLLIIVVMFFPAGIVGSVVSKWRSIRVRARGTP